jgi:hypothetical protein
MKTRVLYYLYVRLPQGGQVVATYNNYKVRVWNAGSKGYKAARARAVAGRK